ncbi:MAG: hypothetical protein M1830_007942 [Pleopsidium flavum]|nr:MAG: hypothetical protein M1830_007942 [Pleopsidium flavum]
MLRLPASQIDLGPNDLSWHSQRLRRRQIERAAGFPTETLHTQQGLRPYAQGQRGSLLYRFPRPPSPRIRNALSSLPNASIISEESVPRDSRVFWDGVVAQAGSHLDSHRDLSSGASQLIGADTSDASAENNDPIAVSNRENLDHVHSQEYSSLDGEYADDLAGSEEHPSVHSQQSSDSGQSDLDEDNYYMELSGQEEENENCVAAVNHLRLHESEKAALQSVEEDFSDVQRHFSDQMDLDGSTDGSIRRRSRHLSLTAELDTDILPDSVTGGAGLVARGDLASVDDDIPEPSFPLTCPGDASTYTPPPLGMEIHRRRPTTLPRSRLHISHAAVTSSPEKRARDQDSISVETAQDPSPREHPPRRRKNYKPRSESYLLVGSEIQEDFAGTYGDPTPGSEPTELPSSPPELIGFYDAASVVHHSSLDGNLSQLSSPYDLSLQRDIPDHLPPGPQVTPILTRNQLRNGTESSPGLPSDILPPPFSASTRTVSFDLALPSSSPASQHSSPLPISLGPAYSLEDEAASPIIPSLSTRFSLPSVPPQAVLQARLSELNHTIAYHASDTYQYPTPTRRSQYRTRTPIMTHEQTQPRRYVPSPSPPPPMTPHRSMRVYNDRLPAYSQPQTPANLRRHRIVDAAFTAPAAFARSRMVTPTSRPRRGTRTPSSMLGRRGLGRSDSPIMQSSLFVDEDQENTGVEEELERRMAALRAWTGLGNQEGEQREGRLESTPPRETRFDWN